jgi:kinesin family member 1
VSIELNKKVQFQFVLLHNSPYSPLTAEFLNASWKNGASLNDAAAQASQQDQAAAVTTLQKCTPRTALAVEVKDLKNGARHYWSMDKFRYVCMSDEICVFVCN